MIIPDMVAEPIKSYRKDGTQFSPVIAGDVLVNQSSWTMNNGSVTLGPVENDATLYIRMVSGDTYIVGTNDVFTEGTTAYSDPLVSISSDTGAEITAIVVYNKPLVEDAENLIAGMASLNAALLIPDVAATQMVRSGITLRNTKIHRSDMFGFVGEEITDLVNSQDLTADIDRAGAKTRAAITATGKSDLLVAGDWITSFEEIVRENEDGTSVQRGVYELSQPSVRSVTRRDYEIRTTGSDIVDRLSRAAVQKTFYTPPAGHIMNDAEIAIRMLGITSMGPNVVSNGSFESEMTDWFFSVPLDGVVTNGFFAGDANYPVADGKLVWGPIFANTNPANGYAYLSQQVALPTGYDRVMVSFLQLTGWSGLHYAWASLRFYDANDVQMPSSTNVDTERVIPSAARWHRRVAVGDIPEGAVRATLYVFAWATDAYPAGQVRLMVDDVQVRGVTGDLLPKSVLALPPNNSKASTRIQNVAGDTLLSAVNDRMSAMSLYAVGATPDGKFTTRPMRSLADDEATRTYDLATDLRVSGEISTEQSVSNLYNHVFAIKEDYATGSTWVEEAINDDVTDPYSIHNIFMEPKRVYAPEAATRTELKAIADQTLARTSMQEAIEFEVIPDPDLSVYDVIEIIAPEGNPARGKWAIESISSSTDEPLMTIGARRTIGGST